MRFATVVLLVAELGGAARVVVSQEGAGAPVVERPLPGLKPPAAPAGPGGVGVDAEEPTPAIPAGTYARPKTSHADPELDEAWKVYLAAIEKATTALREAIDERRTAARKSGDLEAASHYKAILEGLEKKGELPKDDKVLNKSLALARIAYKKAASELEKAYRSAVKRVVKDTELDQSIAERLEIERRQLVAVAAINAPPQGAIVPPPPQVHENFARAVGRWRDTKEGFTWCFFPGGIVVIEELAEGNNHKRGRWGVKEDGTVRAVRGGQPDVFEMTNADTMVRKSSDATFTRLE